MLSAPNGSEKNYWRVERMKKEIKHMWQSINNWQIQMKGIQYMDAYYTILSSFFVGLKHLKFIR